MENDITIIRAEQIGEEESLMHHGYKEQIKELEILNKIQESNSAFEFEVIRFKEEAEMLGNDASLLKMVESQNNDKIILTHGTDTIGLTAEALSEIKNKTIVLTGAMMPEKFRESDADFNVGMAVGAVQKLPHGVYVALHGELQTWEEFVG